MSNVRTSLTLYLPPSSPLFSYSSTSTENGEANGTNSTSEAGVLGQPGGVWVGIAGSAGGVTAGGPAEGWGNSTVSSQALPAGTSLQGNAKRTSANAALALNGIHLTSFSPVFDAPSSYSVSLQTAPAGPSQNWTSLQTHTQAFGPSSLLLSITCSANPAACAAKPFVFRGATIITEIAPPAAHNVGPETPAGVGAETGEGTGIGTGVKSVIADDASGLIAYTGWDPVGKDQRVVEAGPLDYGGTLSMTATANASAVVRFKGTAVLLRGVTAPPLGRISLILDAQPDRILDLRDDVTTHDVPLYFASALNGGVEHQLSLTTLAADPDAAVNSTVIGSGGMGVGAVLDRIEIWGIDGNVGFIDRDGKLVVPPPNTGTVLQPPPTTGNGTAPGTLPGATSSGGPEAGTIVGAILGVLAGLALLYWFFKKYGQPAIVAKKEAAKMNAWDEANMLQNMKNEAVYITTAAKQRYVYPGLIAHSELKK